MALRIASVTFDCRSVDLMIDFWSAALGYIRSDFSREEVGGVEDPRNRDMELVFVQVPEERIVKNRVHLDIGADNRDAEVQRLLSLGAREVQRLENWTVMQDPEGNEFCVIQAPEDDPIEGWRP